MLTRTYRDLFSDFDYLFNLTLPSNHNTNGLAKSLVSSNLSPVSVKDGVIETYFDVAGIPKENLEVSWHKGLLTVKGSSEKYNKKVSYSTRFANIDSETIESELENGILVVKAKLKENKTEEGVKVLIK